MQGLPVVIKNERDLFALVKRYGMFIFGQKKELRHMMTIIEPDEQIYFAIGFTLINIRKRGELPTFDSRKDGSLFISNRRIMFFDRKAKKIASISFKDITWLALEVDNKHTVWLVSKDTPVISFNTKEMRFDIDERRAYDAICQAFADAGIDLPTNEELAEETATELSPQSITCLGCGFTMVLVNNGQINRCEYCERVAGQ